MQSSFQCCIMDNHTCVLILLTENIQQTAPMSGVTGWVYSAGDHRVVVAEWARRSWVISGLGRQGFEPSRTWWISQGNHVCLPCFVVCITSTKLHFYILPTLNPTKLCYCKMYGLQHIHISPELHLWIRAIVVIKSVCLHIYCLLPWIPYFYIPQDTQHSLEEGKLPSY